MPLIEAIFSGTPVIASDLPVFKEVAGAVPDFLSPLDGPGWIQAVMNYSAESSPERAAQLQRMQGFKLPTWDEHFSLVENLLSQLA